MLNIPTIFIIQFIIFEQQKRAHKLMKFDLIFCKNVSIVIVFGVNLSTLVNVCLNLFKRTQSSFYVPYKISPTRAHIFTLTMNSDEFIIYILETNDGRIMLKIIIIIHIHCNIYT